MSKHISLVAQIVLTIVFMVGYLWVLREFMGGHVKVSTDLLELFKALISIITGSLLTIVNFWFMSSRSSQAKDEKSLG